MAPGTSPGAGSSEPSVGDVAAALRARGTAAEVRGNGLPWVDGVPAMLGVVTGRAVDELAEAAVAVAGELASLGRVAIWVRAPVGEEALALVLERVRRAHPDALDWIHHRRPCGHLGPVGPIWPGWRWSRDMARIPAR